MNTFLDTNRHKTGAEWAESDYILPAGTAAYDDDTGRHKYGDGINLWPDLPWPETEPGDDLDLVAVNTDGNLVRVSDGTPVEVDGGGSGGGGSDSLPPRLDAVTVAQDDPNDATSSGFYFVANETAPVNLPDNVTAGPLIVINAADVVTQILIANSTVYTRSKTGSAAWAAWASTLNGTF